MLLATLCDLKDGVASAGEERCQGTEDGNAPVVQLLSLCVVVIQTGFINVSLLPFCCLFFLYKLLIRVVPANIQAATGTYVDTLRRGFSVFF